MVNIINCVDQYAKELYVFLKKIHVTKRLNFEAEFEGNHVITFITFFVETNNSNLFGNGDNIYAEVYPRYKQFCKNFRSHAVVPPDIRLEFYVLLSANSMPGVAIRNQMFQE